jgi:Holliday junction resolvase
MTSIYARGRDMEYRLINKLESMDYTFVARSAGSHTPVDVFAWKSGVAYFFQVKGGKQKLSGRARIELVDLAHDCGAVPVLVTRGLKMEVLSGEVAA